MTTSSDTLSLAFRYLVEASEGIEEAATSDDRVPVGHPIKTALSLNDRTGHRRALKERLEAARELLALLEQECPDATAAVAIESGEEITLTVPLVRMVCYRTEASVMFRCYDDLPTARRLMECAIAIEPSDALNHAFHASLCSTLRDFPAAIASIERAILLDPGDMDYKMALNDFRREQERFAAEQAAQPQRSKWNPKSWLS
jgi:hypothetical protein